MCERAWQNPLLISNFTKTYMLKTTVPVSVSSFVLLVSFSSVLCDIVSPTFLVIVTCHNNVETLTKYVRN